MTEAATGPHQTSWKDSRSVPVRRKSSGRTVGTPSGRTEKGDPDPCRGRSCPFPLRRRGETAIHRIAGQRSRRQAFGIPCHPTEGQKRFNVLLKSDGKRNWVTPEELKKSTEHSSASETALDAKVAELTGKLERLQKQYDSLSERCKVRPRQVRMKIYRWKKK